MDAIVIPSITLRWTLLLLDCSLISTLRWCEFEKENQVMKYWMLAAAIGFASPAVAEEPWMTRALGLLKAEPKIAESLFNQDSPRSLWVSVEDDGTRRDGYAEYLCLVLYDAGMPIGGYTVIHVYDAAAMAAGESREIGRFDCERKG